MDLENWAKKNGCKIADGVHLKTDPNNKKGLHVRTHNNLPANEDIMSIPLDLAISPITILNYSEFGTLLLKKFKTVTICSINLEEGRQSITICGNDNVKSELGLTTDEIIIGFLIFEADDKDSRWNGYLSALPRNIPAAFLWPDADLQSFLMGTGLDRVVIERRYLLKPSIEKLRNAFRVLSSEFNENDLTAAYYWAYCIIKSRAYIFLKPENPSMFLNSLNNLPLSHEDKVKLYEISATGACLLPLLDSFNHEPGTPIVWMVSDTFITFSSPINISADSDINNNYGPKANEELLLFYGFTIDSELQQSLDYVRLNLNSNKAGNNTTVYLKEDMAGLPELVTIAINLIGDDSNEGQVDARGMLIELMERKLESLQTAMERCENMPEVDNALNALVYRRNQVTILSKAIEYLEREIEELYENK